MTSNQGMIFVLKIGDEWDIQSVCGNLWNSLSLEANSCSASHYGTQWCDIVFTFGIHPEPQASLL
jgi:hypothetical protein